MQPEPIDLPYNQIANAPAGGTDATEALRTFQFVKRVVKRQSA